MVNFFCNVSVVPGAIVLCITIHSGENFLKSEIIWDGKFFVIGLVWSFSFQMLSEIRHLIMDMGYGFELQTTRITGLMVIFGSFLLTILIYLIGKNFI